MGVINKRRDREGGVRERRRCRVLFYANCNLLGFFSGERRRRRGATCFGSGVLMLSNLGFFLKKRILIFWCCFFKEQWFFCCSQFFQSIFVRIFCTHMRERECSSSRESFAEAKPTERPSVKLNLHSLSFPFPPLRSKVQKKFFPPSFFCLYFFPFPCVVFLQPIEQQPRPKCVFSFTHFSFPHESPKKSFRSISLHLVVLFFLGGKPIVVQQKNGKWLIPDFSFCYIFILFFSGSNISSV